MVKTGLVIGFYTIKELFYKWALKQTDNQETIKELWQKFKNKPLYEIIQIAKNIDLDGENYD